MLVAFFITTGGAMSRNIRFVDGSVQFRRFAYLHKRDWSQFGLLEAVDHRNARDHLGGRFYIRRVWLTLDESHEQTCNRDLRWKIVLSVFCDLTGPSVFIQEP